MNNRVSIDTLGRVIGRGVILFLRVMPAVGTLEKRMGKRMRGKSLGFEKKKKRGSWKDEWD